MTLSPLRYLFCCLLFVGACKHERSEVLKDIGGEIPYNIHNQDAVFYLPHALLEISGLSFSTSRDALIAINDELGTVYYIDKNSGEVVNDFQFGKKNDYEGIAYQDGQIFIVESNGNVAVVEEDTQTKVKEYKGSLSKNNNIEGLAYHKSTNSLLLAAKGASKFGGSKNGYRSIFEVKLSDGTVSSEPFLTLILADEVSQFPFSDEVAKNTQLVKSLLSRIKRFAPSGIALHPVSGDIYILSSKGSLLVVLDSAAVVRSVIFLNEAMHQQPEGITFDPQGTLYIANEGKSSGGFIYKYDML